MRERPTATLPETPGPGGEDSFLDRAEVWPLVQQLPPRQRAVVVLRYYEDLSEEQIAQALGCSRGTVKSQASDALRSLRRAYEVAAAPEGADA